MAEQIRRILMQGRTTKSTWLLPSALKFQTSDGGGPKGRTLRKGIPARRALGHKKLADVSKYCTSSPAGQTACEEVVTLRGDGR